MACCDGAGVFVSLKTKGYFEHRPHPILGPMPDLFLRRCVIGGTAAPDDYSVIEDGNVIGRIYRSDQRRPEAWIWSITVHDPGRAAHGQSASLAQAKADFRAAWSHS